MNHATVQFDLFAWQVVPWQTMLDDVRYLETLSIGTVWVGDKYALPAPWAGPILDAWTTLAALAASTERVRLGTMVSDLALRHPAMLAKQAATVDRISGGRVDLGVGSGDFYDSQRAWLGLPELSASDRAVRLEEAVKVIDRLLRDRQVTFHGDFYDLDEAPLAPAPVQQPRPPLTIAANGRRALRVAARHADTWVNLPPWGETGEEALASVRERSRLLDENCEAIDRDPATVQRACFVGWSNGDTPFESRDALQDFIGQYREAGVQRLIFSFGSAAAPAPYDAWVANGAWVSREALEGFAAQEMAAATKASSS